MRKGTPPFAVVVAGALRWGSGCTLDNILGEWFALFVPTVAIWFGWQTLFEEKKVDALSLITCQIGVYGVMAFAQFYVFRFLLGVRVEVNTREFWLPMQLAMLAGFVTSYPVNWWLIKRGIKERM